jgi:ABC-type glutathione transport system ATPase component
MSPEPSPLLSVRAVTRTFRLRSRTRGAAPELIRAVDGVDIDVLPGERVGIVGESGSGKSTLARAIVGLCPVDSGSVVFDGAEVTELPAAELRRLRARLQLVLQDPLASLDSRMTVRQIVEEGLGVHSAAPREERTALVESTLGQCGLPVSLLDRKPSALSGGQRQRVALARSLVLRPSLMLLDEPVSALDVSVQAQVLNLLLDLQEAYGLTYVFIVHDLAVARWFCNRIAVMYKGSIVEEGPSEEVFDRPRHAYTRELLAASSLASTSTGAPNGSAATPDADLA